MRTLNFILATSLSNNEGSGAMQIIFAQTRHSLCCSYYYAKYGMDVGEDSDQTVDSPHFHEILMKVNQVHFIKILC